MLLLLISLGLAGASEVTYVSARGEVGAGATATPSAALDGRAALVVGRRSTHIAWMASASSAVSWGVAPSLFDFHTVEFGLQRTGPHATGGQLAMRAGAAQGWADGLAGLSEVATAGRLTVRGRIGPALRTNLVDHTGGAGATMRIGWVLHPRLRLDHQAEIRSWWSSHAAPITADSAFVMRFVPVHDLELLAEASGTVAAKPPGEPQVGFAATSVVGGRATLTTRWWATPGLALHLRGSTEGARLDDTRITRQTLFLGLAFKLDRMRELKTELNPDTPTFALYAPEASSVSVIGDFSGWQPVAMELVRGEWVLNLALSPGTYEYAYMVDGEAVVPPEAELTRDDGFGGRSGVLRILTD